MARAEFANMPQPLKDAFLRVNPDEGALRRMHDKDAARMRSSATCRTTWYGRSARRR